MVIFNGPVRLRVAFKRVTVAAVTTVTVEVATVAAEAGTVATEVAAVVAWPRPDAPCARLSSTARMRSAFTGTQRHRRFTGEGTDARRGGGTLAGRSGPRCCVSSRLSRTSVPLAASASHPGGASRTGGLSSPPCTPWVHVGPPGCRTAHRGVALSPLLGGAPPPGAHGLRGVPPPLPAISSSALWCRAWASLLLRRAAFSCFCSSLALTLARSPALGRPVGGAWATCFLPVPRQAALGPTDCGASEPGGETVPTSRAVFQNFRKEIALPFLGKPG